MCSCCGEFEADARVSKTQDLCLQCAKIMDSACTNCGCELDESQTAKWSPEHRLSCFCDNCQEKTDKQSEKSSWRMNTKQAVADLCDEFGWSMDAWHTAQTGSMYMEATKECDSCILGMDQECDCTTIKIRLSDHATAYCSEDFSICLNGSGDDHDIADLKKYFERKQND